MYSVLILLTPIFCIVFFFFNDTATTEIYTLSLHDALPIFERRQGKWEESTANLEKAASLSPKDAWILENLADNYRRDLDRKSTRLNSSHSQISYAVFCLKKKKQMIETKNGVYGFTNIAPII